MHGSRGGGSSGWCGKATAVACAEAIAAVDSVTHAAVTGTHRCDTCITDFGAQPEASLGGKTEAVARAAAPAAACAAMEDAAAVAARATDTATPLRGRGEEEGGRLGEEVQDLPSRRRAIPTRQRYA